MKRMILTFLVLFIFPQLLFARIIRIPYDYFKIQEGIDAAVNGDTVWIDLGTYFEGINFRGKNILVTSNYIFDHSRQTIVHTVINGYYLDPWDTATVVSFVSGEGPDAIVNGLTITQGEGTRTGLGCWCGGGILCHDSSPLITSNIITDNSTHFVWSGSGYGGGMAVLGSSCPLIAENEITDNYVAVHAVGHGGGVFCDCESVILFDNVINGNDVYALNTGLAGWAEGGGVYARAQKVKLRENTIRANSVFGGYDCIGAGISVGSSEFVEILSNTIESNYFWTDGYYPYNILGAGAYLQVYGKLTVKGNTVNNNYLTDYPGLYVLEGSGMYVMGCPTKVTITWNTFTDNQTEALLLHVTAPMDSLLVARNVIYGDFRGIYCRNCGPRIENNTIYLTTGYGIRTFLTDSLDLHIRNNIIAGTTDGPGILAEGSYVPGLFYNDVWNNAGGNYQGLEPGQFDIHEDPLFVDPERGDFRLTEESPCIDAGDPDPQYNDPDGSRNDIGAFWLGYTPVSETPAEVLPKEFELSQNYPNPFNATTRITYQLVNPVPSKVILEVYNLQGQVVSRLVDDCQTAGIHEVIWRGETKEGKGVSSGVYIYTLCVDGNLTSRKMLLLR